MASLTLKNVPDELLVGLRELAKHDRRSLNQQALHLLIDALQGRRRPPVTPRWSVEAQLAAWRNLAGEWQSDTEEAIEIKQIVGRRSRGRKVLL